MRTVGLAIDNLNNAIVVDKYKILNPEDKIRKRICKT